MVATAGAGALRPAIPKAPAASASPTALAAAARSTTPSALTLYLAAPGVPLAPRAADKAETPIDAIKREIKAGRKAAISDAKGRAREKMQRLAEQLKLIKKLYADNPKMMARQLAALAKELQGAVKDYARAAKDSGEMFSQALKATPDAAVPPETRQAEREVLEEEAKMEAHGDMEFIKLVRSFSQGLKDQLQTTRIKATLTVEGKFEQSEEYEDAEKGLKELDEATESLDQQMRVDMPPGSFMTLKA